ncbi:hypothetical protein [Janthinobacterium sp. PAMC25594]|uniref:hypothetical protein n=1 Tax=Janthinobacterium sp. PAMC25594 TaxID=2861284 RepID=UPI001C638156|nr:hypothetical protein [Janthinobacterium sp. PAMC25594]QYG04811.1 hypothetical protein KY494_15560 [Janthinobacterium sp. PAMC25594]
MTELMQLGPTDVRDFLKSQGWSVLDDALKDRLYVMSNVHFPRRQLVFPMDQFAPDYADSLKLVVERAAEFSSNSYQQIVSKIQSIKDDVLRLRVAFDGDDSALPLSFASAFVQNTEKLLKAAACTVLRPRTHHPRLTLSEAAQFVDQTRFGQTELGSFVLHVACPINALALQGMLEFDGPEAPFVRSVTSNLYNALSQLAGAIEADTVDQLVDKLKASEMPLISSNLCEAISSMHDEKINNRLDLSFDWSLLRRPTFLISNRAISFQRDYFSRIEEIRQELRSAELDQVDTFIGTVEALEGEMGGDGRRYGVVVLSLLLREEGESVRARTSLSPDDYEKAQAAHMQHGAYVSVTGRLRPGRQPRQLKDVSSFQILSRSRPVI